MADSSTDGAARSAGGPGSATGVEKFAGPWTGFLNLTGKALGMSQRHSIVPSAAGPAIFSSITGSGAVCNGTTDDTGTINRFLASLPPGTTVVIPAGRFCLINSGNLQIPPNTAIIGSGGVMRAGQGGGAPSGSGFFLNPAYTIMLSTGDRLEHFGVWRAGLVANPTPAQARAAVAQWWDEWSVAITYPWNAGGLTADDLFLEGFHIGIMAQAGVINASRISCDTTTCWAQFGGGDNSFIQDIRNEPYYSGQLDAAGNWQRYGASYYFGLGTTGWTLVNAQSEGWPMGLVTQDVGGGLVDNLESEYQAGWSTSPPGYPAEHYGVCAHLAGGNPAVVMRDVSCGNAGEIGVYSDGIDDDTDPNSHDFQNLVISAIPSTGYGIYLGGTTAKPIVLTLAAIPAAGKIVSVTVAGASISALGGPFTISYTVRNGDTSTIVARRLCYLLNTQRSELAHAHVTASNSAGGNTVTIYWPEDEAITVTASGGTINRGAGAAEPGVGANISGVDFTNGNWAPGNGDLIHLGNSKSPALSTNIDNIYYAGSSSSLPPNWLVVTKPESQRLTLNGIPWSSVSASNLSNCGGSPSVSTGASDVSGTIAEGAMASGCTLTFTTPFWRAPQCVLGSPSGNTPTRYSVSRTALMIENARGSGDRFTYRCEVN